MRVFYPFFGSILFLLVSFLGEAQSDGVYIVYMGAPRNDHAQLVSQLLMGREKESLLHTLGKSFSGFTARLSDAEAESIARHPEVVSVFRERASQLHTTRSWNFLISQNDTDRSNPILCSVGAKTIIGIIDSGIWPEHPSFHTMLYQDPIPTHWKGECMPDKSSDPFECNNKLIGARYYDDVTARDQSGHGTRVASIAAGNLVTEASYKGLAEGIARGVLLCSRIAVYSVCDANLNCPASDILRAFDDAIADGVDVLSVSLGGEYHDLLTDVIAIGAFHAVENGITVVSSVGNNGPSPGGLRNFAPWIVSVGASTIDRVLQISILLGRNSSVIEGTGIYLGGLKKTAVYHITDGRRAKSNKACLADAMNCAPGSLDSAKVKGKIVLCDSKDEEHDARRDKFGALKQNGAVGVIYISITMNVETYDYSDIYQIPLVAVSDEDGAKIQSYINSTSNSLATLLPTVTILRQNRAPMIPSFSSSGTPHYGKLCLIKPDVVAPGVNILAAVPPVNKDRRFFDFDSGTSQSCPHVSGLAAMLKSVHPTWSPSAIRSAMMTTAIQINNQHSLIETQNGSVATPREMGAGEINPTGSLRPGLVYETSTADYIQFLCNIGYKAATIRIMSSKLPKDFSCPANSSPRLIHDMNYPSIFIKGLVVKVGTTVKRTVTNVGDARSTYAATVAAPAAVEVQVVPNILRFAKNVKTLTFNVSFTLTKALRDDRFGSITWYDGKTYVRSPFFVSNAQEE